MTEPLSDEESSAMDEISKECGFLIRKFVAQLITSHRLLQQRVTQLEEESRQWEKESLVKLIKERTSLQAERDEFEKRLREICMDYGTMVIQLDELRKMLASAVSIAQMATSFSVEEYPVMVKEALDFLARPEVQAWKKGKP